MHTRRSAYAFTQGWEREGRSVECHRKFDLGRRFWFLIRIRVLIALLVVCPPARGQMRKGWEVQFGKKIIEPAGWQSLKYHALQSLAFSADSRWLAVTIDDHQTKTTIGTHILVVEVAAPSSRIRQYDLDACGAPIAWAPDGREILVCGQVVKLQDGQTCTIIEPAPANLPPVLRDSIEIYASSLWLDSQRILRVSPSGLSIVGDNCLTQPTGRADIAAAQVEAPKRIPGWPPDKLSEYKMIDASRTPPRVLAERWGDSFIEHFDIDPWPTVRRRVVWDINERREIASWKPQEGHPYGQGFYHHPYKSCALSPDGHFVAEGGKGVVRLYRLD